ncbi:unnamed protein product [Dovyalis caffra]|uniref:NmrA-like domain-containing protein n=1 Tax=Dovyalis caffra TaxID=77055 RepID=A0AAV1RBX6_9ROSI|nr:unnamed protein product [Dovyalis caffra]
MSSGAGKIVCVTGASGYIASWLVKLLLSRGYTVKASVRDPNDPRKTEHLRALGGAKERLQLFKANLLEEGSFDSIVEGCEGVFHTASPFYNDVKDPQEESQMVPQYSMYHLSPLEGMVQALHWSRLFHEFSDIEAELLDPAVKGTLNVLGSCAKHSSIKRVVLTSSVAAVVCNRKPRTPDVVVDETWFSDPDLCRESKKVKRLAEYQIIMCRNTEKIVMERCKDRIVFTVLTLDMETPFEDELNLNGITNLSFIASATNLEHFYCTLAEDAAWKFAKEKGMDMVAINPAMVIGPLLQPTLNTSAATILSLMKGAQTFPNASFGWVNVKDVANAHIQAFELSSASGRYCLVERVAHYSEIVKILHELYPDVQLPEKCADDEPYVPIFQVSKEKAKSLGIEFISLEESVKETVESLKEKGFVSF